jgi:hypothetical protein
VDFAMAASQNGVCIPQQMILFHDRSRIKDESNKNLLFFYTIFTVLLVFLRKGKLLLLNPLYVPGVAKSTIR